MIGWIATFGQYNFIYVWISHFPHFFLRARASLWFFYLLNVTNVYLFSLDSYYLVVSRFLFCWVASPLLRPYRAITASLLNPLPLIFCPYPSPFRPFINWRLLFNFFKRFGDLYFEAKTGASPAFVFTLSLSFDLNTTTAADATSCTPRWQMSDLEYAIMKNRTKGNDGGKQDCNLHSLAQGPVTVTRVTKTIRKLKRTPYKHHFPQTHNSRP